MSAFWLCFVVFGGIYFIAKYSLDRAGSDSFDREMTNIDELTRQIRCTDEESKAILDRMYDYYDMIDFANELKDDMLAVYGDDFEEILRNDESRLREPIYTYHFSGIREVIYHIALAKIYHKCSLPTDIPVARYAGATHEQIIKSCEIIERYMREEYDWFKFVFVPQSWNEGYGRYEKLVYSDNIIGGKLYMEHSMLKSSRNKLPIRRLW